MKAEKYGGKILDEIKSYEPKKEMDEEPSHKKNKKPLVVIESSEDEAWKFSFYMMGWSSSNNLEL